MTKKSWKYAEKYVNKNLKIQTFLQIIMLGHLQTETGQLNSIYFSTYKWSFMTKFWKPMTVYLEAFALTIDKHVICSAQMPA